MATAKANETAKLVINVEVGADSNGKAKYAQRSILALDPAISDDDARAIGTLYGGLQTYPVGTVVRQSTAALVED